MDAVAREVVQQPGSMCHGGNDERWRQRSVGRGKGRSEGGDRMMTGPVVEEIKMKFLKKRNLTNADVENIGGREFPANKRGFSS